MSKTAIIVLALLLAGGAQAAPRGETEGLREVKAFTLENAAQLVAGSKRLRDAVADYAAIIEANSDDYEAAWSADGAKLAEAVTRIRTTWLAASDSYENIEGIVAGVPSLVKYDLILDAGNPAGAEADVAPYDLGLPDGTVLQRPGSLFHTITEPLYWGGDTGNARAEVDLDGDGTIEPGEVLFETNLALGAAEGLVKWSGKLAADIEAWQPSRDDAFTAVVTMTPTVGDYFGEWKESQFLGGDEAAFVARSRLVDVIDIMSGCERMYRAAVAPVVKSDDPALDASISSGFEELLALVRETRAREESGARFSPEEADALGADAQDIAERIVAQVLQAAARSGVDIRG